LFAAPDGVLSAPNDASTSWSETGVVFGLFGRFGGAGLKLSNTCFSLVMLVLIVAR
jgi:hypothetical protein